MWYYGFCLEVCLCEGFGKLEGDDYGLIMMIVYSIVLRIILGVVFFWFSRMRILVLVFVIDGK